MDSSFFIILTVFSTLILLGEKKYIKTSDGKVRENPLRFLYYAYFAYVTLWLILITLKSQNYADIFPLGFIFFWWIHPRLIFLIWKYVEKILETSAGFVHAKLRATGWRWYRKLENYLEISDTNK